MIMDDFLLDAPKSGYDCNSVEDLQLQLSHLRESKVTHTKAHHLSATFEFRPTVVFDVPESDSDVTDSSQIHESASASATSEAATNGVVVRPARKIRAQDTLMNQPNDDPILQRAVAKLIITSLGDADGSSWSVREISRSATGWTFQYICKNSIQAWMLQNAKNAAKVLVGESSGKDGQDPVNLARPAFDCRGSVTIAFVRNSRMITVKFEHTPMHKTVAELADIFKPPPPPTRAVGAARKDRESQKRKASAGNGSGNDEGGAKKKRKKKKPASPDDPMAEGQASKPKRPRSCGSKEKGTAAQVAADGPDDAMLNLSPSEAARRRDEATQKLSENGVDPATLSQEQFDIFANQSPELQNESLAMLIKYGAERLRIVHPNKDNASSNPAQAYGGPADSSGKKKKSRRKGFNEDGTPRIKKTRGGCQACRAKKTKCSKAKPECNECVEAGIECYYPPEQKRKPNKSDDVAEDEGPGEQASASDPAVAGPAAADVVEPVAMPEPEPELLPEEEASDLGSPGFNSSHSAAPSKTLQQADTSRFQETSHDLYQPSAGGLSYPQAVPDNMGAGMDYSAYSSQLGQQQLTQSGMAYPQQSQQTSNVSYPDQSAPPVPAPEPIQPTQTPARSTRAKPPRSGPRRSLASATSQNDNGYSNPETTTDGSAWQAANAPTSATQTYTSSSSPRHSRAGRAGTQTAAPLPAQVYDASQQEALAAAATLSQAAFQKKQPSPTARTVSPFQNANQAAAQGARAKSRQGQRAQSRTKASTFKQASSAQPSSVGTAAIYSQPSTSTEPNNLPSYDQHSRYNMAATQNGQASSRGGYDAYTQQTNSNNLPASYAGYDTYNARSQSSSTTPIAASVTQGVSASHTKTAGPSTSSWPKGAGHRSGNPYSANSAAVSAESTYNAPASSTQQQQPANIQSFNVRPQSTAHIARTSTPTYNSQQQVQQQIRQQQPQQQQLQQQSYNSYSAQSRSSSSQQPSQQQQRQQQQQQDWYGFGPGNSATPGYGSGSRGADYSQSSQHRPAAMNISGNTCQSMGDQDLYEIFRGPPAH